uniref:DUF5723 family protein n=1 Tax=uncultured Draconibacterium sp. TaxID=1573823 RepID=UPI003217AC46
MKDSVCKKFSLWILLITVIFPVLAQDGNPLQFLSDVSQSSRINPAFQNKTDKLIIGLPVLAGITVNWQSNFPINNLSTNNFTTDFYNSLENKSGKAFYSTHIPLIFLSFKNNIGTFRFSVSEKIIGKTNFSDEMVNFIAQGLLPYYGKSEDFGPLSFSSHYYREIAFAYSTEIIPNLHIGIRPKILFSKFYYAIEDAFYKVETLNETEILVLKPEGNYTVSGPIKVVVNQENNTEAIKPDIKPGDYFINFRNMGTGIDLGLNFTPNKETELSVSILDIGFTGLKHKTYNVTYTHPIHYTKEDLYQSAHPEAPRYWSPSEALAAFSDSIPSITTINNIQKGLVKTLPLQINAMLRHKLANHLQFGLSNHFTYYKNQSVNYLTGFIGTRLGQNFELAGTINVYDFERVFPGLGASYTSKSLQYFISTNNFLELVQPTSAKNLNLCFGVNFLFSKAEN